MDPVRSESAHQDTPIGQSTLVIRLTGGGLAMETIRSEGGRPAAFHETLNLKLDGSETTSTGNAGVAVIAKAHWDGNRLFVETLRNVQDSTVTTLYVHSLSANGREMTVDKTLTVQHGYQGVSASSSNTGHGKDIFVRVAAPDVQPQLDLQALSEPLRNLTPAEHDVVDKAIKLIGQKKHIQALQDLTGLTASNPMNSGLRVLRAYVLLELGNVTGALGDARNAEDSGAHSPYKCWFLAQVAYLAGDQPLCRREIKHLAGNTEYQAQVEKLAQDLKTQAK